MKDCRALQEERKLSQKLSQNFKQALADFAFPCNHVTQLTCCAHLISGDEMTSTQLRLHSIRHGTHWVEAIKVSAKDLSTASLWENVLEPTEREANWLFKTALRVQGLTFDMLLLRYQAWPFRLLDLLQADDCERQVAAVELLSARDCVLDNYSRWVRRRFPTVLQLIGTDCVTEITVALESLLCTTYATERLHSANLRRAFARRMTHAMSVSDIALAHVGFTAPHGGGLFRPDEAEKRDDNRKPTKEVTETQGKRRRGGGGAFRAFTHVWAQETEEHGRTSFSESARRYKNLSQEEHARFKELGEEATRNHRLGFQAFPLTRKHVLQKMQKQGSLASSRLGGPQLIDGEPESNPRAPGLERCHNTPLIRCGLASNESVSGNILMLFSFFSLFCSRVSCCLSSSDSGFHECMHIVFCSQTPPFLPLSQGPSAEDLQVFVAAAEKSSCRKARAKASLDTATAIEVLLDYDVTHGKAYIEGRQLFRDMCGDLGEWHCMPHPLGPAMVHTMSAMAAVPVYSESSGKDWESAWQIRHDGIRAPPKSRVPPVRYSPCHYHATCVCQVGPLRTLTTRLASLLKQQSTKDVLAGDLVLRWRCESWSHSNESLSQAAATISDISMDDAVAAGYRIVVKHIYTHVSACNLRPFRPTLALLRPLADEWSEHVEDIAGASVLELVQVTNDSGEPTISSMYEFLSSLDLSGSWYVQCCKMSDRERVIPGFQGQAYVIVHRDAAVHDHCLWSGSEDLPTKSKGGRARRSKLKLHEAMQRGSRQARNTNMHSETSQDAQGPANADQHTFVNSMNGQGPEDLAEAAQGDMWADLDLGSQSDTSPDLGNASEELLQAAAPLQQPADRREVANPVSDSSSSSSSSSSGSSSSSVPLPGPLREQGFRRSKHEGSFKWKVFLFTWRRPATKDGKTSRAAWQVTCPYHADYNQETQSVQTACTRSKQVSVNDPSSPESVAVINTLKAWLRLALQHDSKASHQQVRERAANEASVASAEEFPSPARVRKFTNVTQRSDAKRRRRT